MVHKVKLIGAFLLTLQVLTGCRQEEEKPFSNPIQIEQYFPIKAFIEERLPEMDGKEVEKSLILGDRKENSRQQYDQDGWRRELDIFIHADINKASLANAYHTEQKGNSSSHRLKEGEKGEVKILSTFQSGPSQVDSIYFKRKKSNLFYSSSAEGTLVLKDNKIHSYLINGEQKVWFLPTNRMQVRGIVVP